MHATEFLKNADLSADIPLVAVYGGQRYLKQAVLQRLIGVVLDGDDASLSTFAGKDVEWATVADELFTVSMWSDRRLVSVQDADDFVSKFRERLENYLDKPARKSTLVLDVKSWTKTTRLAKRLAKVGFALDCAPLKGAELMRWLTATSQQRYGKKLERSAAQLLIELAGEDLGLLDQELAKLANYAGERGRIDPEDVRALVGGWKAETTWAMTDALRAGNLDLALSCLDKLLVAGEPPQKILGGLNFVFRKLAKATELARQGQQLNFALKDAGVFPRDINSSAAYLRRVGRPQAEKLLARLLEADLSLKGSSGLSHRLQLEELMLQLTGRG